MMSEDEIIKELKKLKKPYPDFSKITIIPVKEGLAKKIEQSFVMKNSNHYRVILMEGYGKIFVEFYNVKDLNKKWINKTTLDMPTIIKESAYFLKNGMPQQKKHFLSKKIDSTFRNVSDQNMEAYLKNILS